LEAQYTHLSAADNAILQYLMADGRLRRQFEFRVRVASGGGDTVGRVGLNAPFGWMVD